MLADGVSHGGDRLCRAIEDDAVWRHAKLQGEPKLILGDDLRSDAGRVDEAQNTRNGVALVGVVKFCARAACVVDGEKVGDIPPQSLGQNHMKWRTPFLT